MGILHGFGQKFQIGLFFFLGKFGLKTLFGGFLDRKLAFLNH